MTTVRWMLCAAWVGAWAGGEARAAEQAAPRPARPGLAKACQAEIAAGCGDAEAAAGGQAACLAKQGPALGKPCRAALRRARRVGAFRAACGEDVTQACSGITPGKGRIRACLRLHEETLSAACRERLGRAAGTQAASEEAGIADEAAQEERKGIAPVPADLPVEGDEPAAATPPATPPTGG